MQSPPKPMSPNPDNLMPQPFENPPMATSNAAAVTISTQVMIAAVIFLFMAVVFIFFLYLYAKYYMGSDSLHRRRAHFVFAAPDPVPNGDRGLDAELLKALPIKSYSPSEFQEGLECAVCLSEISEGEKLRLLPKCSHGFHVECIDTWFQSHSTCPLCRVPVMVTGEAEAEADIEQGNSLNLNFPTNVLFWGNQEQVRNGAESLSQTEEGTSSSSKLSKKPEGMLVIDIPRRSVEEFFSPMVSPLPTSKFSSEEMKTPKTPRSARLRSLTKLLNRGKMVIASSSPSSSSPKGGDIEQGLGVGSSTLGPKTPASK